MCLSWTWNSSFALMLYGYPSITKATLSFQSFLATNLQGLDPNFQRLELKKLIKIF